MNKEVKLGDIDEATDYPVKPVGWYTVGIETVERKTGKKPDSAGKKWPYLNLMLNIESGTHEGQKLFKVLSLKETALPFLKPFMMALGYQNDFVLNISETGIVVGLDPENLVGETLQVRVEHQKDKNTGKVRENITAFMNVGDSNDLTEADQEQIASESSPASDDEEIPF